MNLSKSKLRSIIREEINEAVLSREFLNYFGIDTIGQLGEVQGFRTWAESMLGKSNQGSYIGYTTSLSDSKYRNLGVVGEYGILYFAFDPPSESFRGDFNEPFRVTETASFHR